MEKKYKAIFVLETTHNKVAVEAKRRRLTMDKFINKLLKDEIKQKNNE